MNVRGRAVVGMAQWMVVILIAPLVFGGSAHGQLLLDFEFDRYALSIGCVRPFGITSLRYREPDQPADFAHYAATEDPGALPFPLADWEWFWLEHYEEAEDNPHPFREKVMVTAWPDPEVNEAADIVTVSFEKPDVLIPGITLRQEFLLHRDDASYEVTYEIHNGTSESLRGPYCMLGFPGFMNHRAATAVSTAGARRCVEPPYSTFYEEALGKGLYQYPLIRDDWHRGDGPAELKGQVDLSDGQRTYSLLSTFVPTEDITHAHSGHTNKQVYLTSHLYVFLEDIPAGQTRRMRIATQLLLDAVSAVEPISWGALKGMAISGRWSHPQPSGPALMLAEHAHQKHTDRVGDGLAPAASAR